MNLLIKERMLVSADCVGGNKETTFFEKQDPKAIINNFHILIVPTSSNHQSKEDILKSEKLITFNSEEFLKAFESLLEIRELKAEPTVIEQTIKRKDNFGHGDVHIGAAGDSSLSSIRKCSVGTQTDNNVVDGRPRAFSADLHTSKRQKDSKHLDDYAMPTGTTKVSLCTVCQTIANKKEQETAEINKLLSVDDEVKPAVYCNNSLTASVSEEELKNELRSLPSTIRNVWVADYLESATGSADITRTPAMKYLQSHINLFSDFADRRDVSVAAYAKLTRRYIFHMKRLITRFCRKPDRPGKVIKFDQSVISFVRKSASWDFKNSWFKAEDNWQEKLLRDCEKPAPDKSYSKQEYQRSRTGAKRRRRRSPSPPVDPVKTSRYAINDLHPAPQPVSNITAENNGRGMRDIRHIESILTTRNSTLLQRIRLSPDTSEVYRSGFNEFIADSLFQNDYENEAKTRGFCKYFNDGHCFKPASECSYIHRCDICRKTDHGRRACLHS